MANEQTIKINLKAVADFNDVASNVQEIQKVLSQLKLPDNLKNSFSNTFKELDKVLSKAQGQLDKGFQSKSDLTAYSKSIKQINALMSSLQSNMSKINPNILKDSFQIDTSALDRMNQKITEAKKKLSQEIGKTGIVSNISAAVDELNKLSKVSGLKDLKNNLAAGDLDKVADTLNRLNTQVSKNQEKIAQGNPKWVEYAARVKELNEAFQKIISNAGINKIVNEVNTLTQESKNLNQIELDKFLNQFNSFSNDVAGAADEVADLTQTTYGAAESTVKLNSEMEQMKSKITMFFGLNNAVLLFQRALRSAYATIQDLDKVMTETAVVTNFSVGDMWDQLPEYTQRANELGVSIHDAYEAATLYYQQGLETNQVMQITNATLKMGRIASLSASDATDRMTNALRGFNMEINEMNAERISDVYSKLAAMSASNVDEISTAMTKVASLANSANMEFETTSALLAQMIETTREAPETAGTALKTIVARFSEVKELVDQGALTGQDSEGEEININKVSKALRLAGINLNDFLNGSKGLDDILIELASKWDDLDIVQQRYIATIAAGSRQQSRFLAMMSDYKRTMELVNGANNSAGASQQQYEKTLESLETKLNKLKNAWNEFIMSLANNTIVKVLVDALTKLLTGINKLTSWLPGITSGFAKLWITIKAFKLGKSFFDNLFKAFAPNLAGQAQQGAKVFSDTLKKGLITQLSNIKASFQTLKFGAMFNTETKQASQGLQDLISNFEGLERIQQHWNGLTDDAQGQQLSDAYDNLIDDIIQAGISEETFGNIQAANLDTEQLRIAATLAQTGALEGMTAAEIEEAVTSAELFNLKKQQIAQKIKGIAITTAEILANSKLTKGTIIQTAAEKALTLAKKEGIKASLKALGIIGAIILVIGGLIASIVKLINVIADSTPEARLAATQAAAEKAGEAADIAADKYNNLREALNSIGEHTSDLDGLVEGTQEWKDAVSELNNEVLKLLEDYPELAQFMSREDGVLTIDYNKEVNGQKASDVLGSYRKEMNDAQTAQLMANKAVSEAQVTVDTSNLKKEISSINDLGSQNIERIAKAFGNGEIALNEDGTFDFSSYDTGLMPAQERALNENINLLREYSNSLMAAEVAQDNYNQAIVDSALENTNLSKSEKAFTSQIWSNDKIDAEIEKAKDEVDMSGWKDEYAQSQGYKNYEKYEEEKGSLEGDEEDAAKAYVKAARATEAVSKNIQNISTALAGANLTNQEKNLLSGKLSQGDLNNINLDVLWNKIEESGLYDNQNDFEKQMNTNIDQANQQSKSANKLDGPGFGKIASIDQLNFSAIETFTTKLNDVAISSGKDITNRVISLFNSITKDMNPEEANRFTEALSQIDWTDTNDIDSLADTLKEMGFSAEVGSKEYEELIKNIKEGSNAINKFNLERFTKEIDGARAALADLFANSDKKSFSEDEYNNIVAANEALSSDFVKQLDGSFTYIGESNEQLVQALQENTIALLSKTKDMLSDQLEASQILNDKDTEGNSKDTEYSDFLDNAASMSDDEVKTQLTEILGNLIGAGIDLSTLGISGLSNDTKIEDLNSEGLLKIVNGLKQVRDNTNQYETGLKDVKVQQATTEALGMNNADQVASEITKMQNNENKDEDQSRLDGFIQALESMMVNAGVGDKLRTQVEGKQDQQASLTNTFQEAQTLGLDTTQLNEYALALQKVNTELSAAESAEIALANTKLNEGINEIISSYEDWTSLIDKSTGTIKASSSDDIAAFNNLKKSVNKMLNTSEDLSDAFWDNATNMKNIKKVAEGDTKALGELQKAAAEDYLVQVATEADTNEAYQAIMNLNDFINDYDLPTLEAGVSLDDSQFIAKCNEMIAASGMTATQVSDYFKNIGYDAEVKMKEAKAPGSTRTVHTSGTRINPASGEKEPVEATYTETVEPATVMVPVVKSLTSTGSGGGGFSVGNQNAGRKSSGGGGGGGSSKSYENKHDKRYNLVQDIAEEQRTLNKLQDQYNDLLLSANVSAEKLSKNYKDQVASLKKTRQLNQQMLNYRKKDFKEYLNENSKYSQYGTYNWKDNTIEINWGKINAIKDEEKGSKVDEYISKLEEFEGYMDDVNDTLMEINNQISELAESYQDAYITGLNTVKDALVEVRQKEIDKLSSLNDTINDSNSRMFDAIQKAIDDERQARENEKTEEDIANKENRLAQLQMDTSGGNQLEILQLQKEIDEAREGYQDSLIDQQIARMQEDADAAAEQRDRQISLLEEQLEIDQSNGEIWSKVFDIWNTGFTSDGKLNWGSPLAQLLRETADYQSMSDAEKIKYTTDKKNEMALAKAGETLGYDDQIDYSQEIKAAKNGGVSKQTGIDYGKLGKEERNQRIKVLEQLSNQKNKNRNKDKPTTSGNGEKKQEPTGSGNIKSMEKQIGHLLGRDNGRGEEVKKFQRGYNELIKDGLISGTKLEVDGKDGSNTTAAIKNLQKLIGVSIDGYWGKKSREAFKKSKFKTYKTGGLADFTGPAWLDGTKSHPELVLNARDTENFIQLKDILSNVLKRNSNKTENSGDNYFEIHIDVERIEDDYDVEQLADKIKGIIQQDAMYRNVNVINRLR